MTFQSVPETASVFIEFLQNGVNFGNTFYARKSGGYSQTDLEDLATDMDSWVSTELLPYLSGSCVYVRTIVRGLENEEDYEVENNDSTGAGSVGGNPCPNNVSWVAKRLSGYTGRTARGRIYIGGIAQGSLGGDENTLSTTSITNILTALLEIASYIVTHGWVEVIVSRFHNSVKRLEATTENVTDWSFTNSTLDTQKRRLVA